MEKYFSLISLIKLVNFGKIKSNFFLHGIYYHNYEIMNLYTYSRILLID